MIWYDNTIDVDGQEVRVQGIFEDSTIKIIAEGHILYQKHVNFWRYQDILAEDILEQYRGMVLKCERKLPQLIKAGKIIK